jgi:hypothetical protein
MAEVEAVNHLVEKSNGKWETGNREFKTGKWRIKTKQLFLGRFPHFAFSVPGPPFLSSSPECYDSSQCC